MDHVPSLKWIVVVALVLVALSGCYTTRKEQSSESLLRRRVEYRQGYLDATNERDTMLIEKTKAQLDEYKAGRRSEPPVLDYLVISGGGGWGGVGAGVFEGGGRNPK